MTVDNREAVAVCLRLYASAVRNDWSDFDGRSNRDALGELADYLSPSCGIVLQAALWTEGRGICSKHGEWQRPTCASCQYVRRFAVRAETLAEDPNATEYTFNGCRYSCEYNQYLGVVLP